MSSASLAFSRRNLLRSAAMTGAGLGAFSLVGSPLFSAQAWAQAAEARDLAAFEAWLVDLRAEARDAGISQDLIASALSEVTFEERVIEQDRNQPERRRTFVEYRDALVSESRVRVGREQLAENRDLLERVAARFGVQPRFIVALWGIESFYGRYSGRYQIIPSLVTLAYDARRSAYFRRELLNALRIVDEGHISLAEMTGSWAGAMGQPQFMPSSFLSYAVDFDGDGQKDIWSTRADIFASAANYLGRQGWRNDITWGRRVQVPRGLVQRLANPGEARPLSAWQALGLRRADGRDLPGRDLQARLVQPDGPGGPSYLTYGNFDVLLRWNRSTYFALSVGLLSDALGAGA